MLWAWTGLLWSWIKNKGRKNFLQLKKENPDYEQIGVDILWNLFLGLCIATLAVLVFFGIYTIVKI